MNEDLVRRCLSLSLDEKKLLVAKLQDAIHGRENCTRGTELLDIYSGVIGRKVNLFSRDSVNVWAKTMVAYRMIQEGYSLESVTRQLYRRDHSVIIHYRQKMEDALSLPDAYRDIIEIWNEFQKRIDDDIHN